MIELSDEYFFSLQKTYWQLDPPQIPAKFLNKYEDIISLYDFLKRTRPNSRIANKVATIILDRIHTKKRFQKYPLIRLLKIHSLPYKHKPLVDKLFEIFQLLICTANEDTGWGLSTLIKDKELSPDQVDWLIQNAEKSKHILNRLLRFPVANKRISDWALQHFTTPEHDERRSEFIGLIINNNTDFYTDNNEKMIWAVYYSKLPDSNRKDLLKSFLEESSLFSFMEVSKRLGYTDLIEDLYNFNEEYRQSNKH